MIGEMENPQPACRGAEAVLNMQPNSSISITYDPVFGPHDDLILLELDEKLLPDILQQRVTLRGQPDEDAVLCTQSKTYAVKFVGTSNSVLLIPPSNQSAICEGPQDFEEIDEKGQGKKVVASVIKLAPGSMELVEVAPRLDKLRLLLAENPYSFGDANETMGREGTEMNTKSLYKWEDLINRIQASDDELRSGLQALSAVEIDGYWRILDEKYADGILNMLLHNLVLNDWSFNALNEDDVVTVLESDGFPRKIAQHCLRAYGCKLDNNGDSRSCMWRLDEKRICVHIARGVIGVGKMKMENFMREWIQRIPEGMHAGFDMLEGEVLTEKLGIETLVRRFSVSSLPSSPAERFSILFRERPRWEWKDLEPYIRDLCVPGLSSEGLLLKYTRRTQPTPEAEPIFSAR